MSSVSESLDIKRRKNVVVVHSWEDRSHGSLLNCFNFVRQVARHAGAPYWILVRVGLLTYSGFFVWFSSTGRITDM